MTDRDKERGKGGTCEEEVGNKEKGALGDTAKKKTKTRIKGVKEGEWKGHGGVI